MRAYNKCLTAVLALCCLVSCQEEIRPQDERCVKINAAISPTLITRVSDDGALFLNGDVIRVENQDRLTENIADYTYASSANTWSTSDNLFWEGKQNNEFQAWYPAESSYSEFDIPLDQSQGYSSADWMTAHAIAKQSDGIVNFAFAHHLSKVTVNVVGWGSEYAEDNRTLNSVHIATVSETVAKSDEEIIGASAPGMVNAYSYNNTFSAVVAPGKYEADSEIVHLYINGSSEPLVVKAKADINLLSGKAYKYNVTIGRDVIILDDSDVTVTEWVDEELLDQELTDIS